jgi:glucosylceramidase
MKLLLARASLIAGASVGLLLVGPGDSASAEPAITCGGQPATILGTPGRDTLVGTPGPDVIVGFGGNDKISGLEGDDVICPDQPDDAAPESGNDQIDAGPGNDVIMPGPGADSVDGGGSPAGGYDVVQTGDGNDTIKDVGDGSAYLTVGAGTDRVSAEVGGEIVLQAAGVSRAALIAGGDIDLGLAGAANVTTDAGRDINLRLTGPSNVRAEAGGDINGTSEAATLLHTDGFAELNFVGSPAEDRVVTEGSGAPGNVNLELGDGNDVFRGEAGSADGAVNISGGSGDDLIRVPAAGNVESQVVVRGGPGSDRITGSPNRPNILVGEEGDDVLRGGSAEDILLGEEGDDALVGEAGADGFDGGPGNDTLSARDGQRDLFFSCGDGIDTVRADALEDGDVNRSGCAESRVAIEIEGEALTSLLPGTSVATFTWRPGEPVAHEWLTAANGASLSKRLAPQPDLSVGTPAEDGATTIGVFPQDEFQTIEGFGGAMTQAAAHLLEEEPAGRRAQMIKALFSTSGGAFNYVRVPMGATDLSTEPYEYDPLPPGQTSDPNLEHFSVAHDEADLIPALRQARTVNPDLKLMASPWSAPGWMKISEHFIPVSCEGSADYLKQSSYPVYADYFLRFLQAYRELGLPVAMVSLQNEPHNCKTSYPTMRMEPADQDHLARELRPLLDEEGFSATGILAWDHNWSEKNPDGEDVPTEYPQQVIEGAEGNISAVGYHCYDKNPAGPEVQSGFHAAFPEIDVYFTECSGFDKYATAADNLVNEVRDALIGPLRNWARTSLYWSLVQRSDGRPFIGGCTDCRGMLAVDPDTGNWTRSEDYYYWSQFSKFVERGAVRISSTDPPDQSVETVAFRNPDGSIVVVALNTSDG